MKRKNLLWVIASAAVLFSFALGVLYAQDVMKVGADTHSVLLENDNVRVLKVSIKPGGKVPMHSHPHNVGYYLSDAKVKITTPDGKTQERELKAGTSAWNEAVTHAVENVGSTELQEIQIELKK
ncbi:MAG TPA: cupin domain-containing protein [Terriglobales bacterium]|jgi:quercetin dioxygenase-like cupin family protein